MIVTYVNYTKLFKHPQTNSTPRRWIYNLFGYNS